jgi:hypothetical protein
LERERRDRNIWGSEPDGIIAHAALPRKSGHFARRPITMARAPIGAEQHRRRAAHDFD